MRSYSAIKTEFLTAAKRVQDENCPDFQILSDRIAIQYYAYAFEKLFTEWHTQLAPLDEAPDHSTFDVFMLTRNLPAIRNSQTCKELSKKIFKEKIVDAYLHATIRSLVIDIKKTSSTANFLNIIQYAERANGAELTYFLEKTSENLTQYEKAVEAYKTAIDDYKTWLSELGNSAVLETYYTTMFAELSSKTTMPHVFIIECAKILHITSNHLLMTLQNTVLNFDTKQKAYLAFLKGSDCALHADSIHSAYLNEAMGHLLDAKEKIDALKNIHTKKARRPLKHAANNSLRTLEDYVSLPYDQLLAHYLQKNPALTAVAAPYPPRLFQSNKPRVPQLSLPYRSPKETSLN